MKSIDGGLKTQKPSTTIVNNTSLKDLPENLLQSWADVVNNCNGYEEDVFQGYVNNTTVQNNSKATTPVTYTSSMKPKSFKYWEIVVVCFVVWSNPPLHVIDGFVRCIWKDLDIDTVGTVDSGVFIVPMKSIEVSQKAYKSNGVLFDNKPFIIKPWKPEMPTDNKSLSTLTVRIQLPKLKMEY